MTACTEALMTSTQGTPLPLLGVAVTARLLDLLGLVEVTQRYRNDGESSIEAVYTFPLPPGATLLDLELTIGQRRLRGQVVEKRAAEIGYERAIEAGHSALMLEKCGEGLYTLNLGHLLPGEEAVVRFRYGLIGRWNGDEYALRLPTTLAPRYGDAAVAGLAPHQQPRHSLDADYPFSLRVEAFGRLHDAVVASPSHALIVTPGEGRTVISLRADARLDRDCVLSFRVLGDLPAFAWYANDGERYCAWASFRPAFTVGAAAESPRSLRLVIDCSGSMQGDSLAAAKAALMEILAQLTPHDRFNLTAFGSEHATLFNREVAARPVNLAIARTWLHQLGNMGGTELATALEAACAQPAQLPERDVLLITDGEVWDDTRIAGAASEQHFRIFAVGVGNAPAEALLHKVAAETGGAVEMVTPGEDIARHIVRHFERLRLPRAEGRVGWPSKIEWPRDGSPIHCFPGDTVNAFAVLGNTPEGAVCLRCASPTGDQEWVAPLVAAPAEVAADLPRLVAASWLKQAREKHALAIALRYQLVSEHTNFLVVLERAPVEAGDGLPELVVVPQMLAAGWGGTATVLGDFEMPAVIRRRAPDMTQRFSDARGGYAADQGSSILVRLKDTLRRYVRPPLITPMRYVALVAGRLHRANGVDGAEGLDARRLRHRAPAQLCAAIEALTVIGHDERRIWLAVAWLLLVTTSVGAGAKAKVLDRIGNAMASAELPEDVVAQLMASLSGTTEKRWGFEFAMPLDAVRDGRSEVDRYDLPAVLRRLAE